MGKSMSHTSQSLIRAHIRQRRIYRKMHLEWDSWRKELCSNYATTVRLIIGELRNDAAK